MKDIIKKLMADMARRLSGSDGGRFRPDNRERASWGGTQIPFLIPILFAATYIFFSINAADELFYAMQRTLRYFLFTWPGWITAFLLFLWARKIGQKGLDLYYYGKLLRNNERFTLVEYCKYLKRQITRARKDESLGGKAELSRMRELHRRFNDLLKEGAGNNHWEGIPSTLAEEADQAEALIEFYDHIKKDPLSELDARLPADIRQRVEDFDHDVGNSGRRRVSQ